MEAENLERAKQEEAVAVAQDATKKKIEEQAKAKGKADPVTLAGEAKFGALARIGGALGGRNPVLDMAKQQLNVQKENLAAAEEIAQGVGVLAGTKG